MNATKNKTAIGEKTQQELLTEIIHRLKHLEKNDQEIKSHLWRQPGNQPDKPTTEQNRDIIAQEAVNYINNVVMPDIEAAQAQHEGEIGAQGLGDWLITQLARPVAEYLKAQALEYIGDAVNELKKKAIPYAVQAADWILDKLENIIVSKWKEATEEQQEQFKESIEQHFPNSRLLEKLN